MGPLFAPLHIYINTTILLRLAIMLQTLRSDIRLYCIYYGLVQLVSDKMLQRFVVMQ